MSKSGSIGTKFKVGTNEVGGLKSIDGVDITADTIDVSDLANTDGYKEFVQGFKDAGEVALSGFLDGSDAGQEAIMTALNAGTETACTIVFPTAIGKTWSFNAVVTEYKTGVDLSDAITFDAKLKISGKPTLAATVTQ